MTDDLYFPWRTTDGLTHLAWAERPEMFAGRYTVCDPLRCRMHVEGQGIGGAVITCVRCVVARPRQITIQVHDELLLDVPALPMAALPDLPIPPSVDADLGKSW